MSVRVLLIALATASLATLAQAQDAPIARTSVDAAPPAVVAPDKIQPAATPQRSSGDPTQDQIDAWLKADADPVQPLDPHATLSDPVGPRQIHGEVTTTVSNRGYGASAAASVPIGEASELDVAVGAAHVRTPWGGRANPKSVAVGLFLDGRDIDHWLSRDKCHVPRWGVSLPGDPQVQADGSCVRGDSHPAAAPAP